MSYSNGTISEYIGSNIYKIIGIPVQESIYPSNDINKSFDNYVVEGECQDHIYIKTNLMVLTMC